MSFLLSVLLSTCLVVWLQPGAWGGFAIGVLSYMAVSAWRAITGDR